MNNNIELDELIARIDKALLEEKFEEIGKEMSTINVENNNSLYLVCYLTKTLQYKEKIPYRETFFGNIEKVLVERIGLERTENILSGLK